MKKYIITFLILIPIALLILIPLLQSSDTEAERQRKNEIEKISSKSVRLLLEMDIFDVDSIRTEWGKIHADSAELGLIYLQNLDSIYKIQSEELRAEIIKEIEILKRKFTYSKDEFDNVGLYRHKRWGNYWPNRKTLTSGVSSSGYTWLKSNYSDDDWLFHTSIHVLIGDKKLTSATVERYSKNNRSDHDGGRVWEVITYHYTDILREIAENTDKKIKIRFNGSEFYSDATLSAGDKQALKDCYDLGQLIKLIEK